MKLTTLACAIGVASAAVGTPCTMDNRWGEAFECDEGECCGYAIAMRDRESQTAPTPSSKLVCNKIGQVVYNEDNLLGQYYFFCGTTWPKGVPLSFMGASSLIASTTIAVLTASMTLL